MWRSHLAVCPHLNLMGLLRIEPVTLELYPSELRILLYGETVGQDLGRVRSRVRSRVRVRVRPRRRLRPVSYTHLTLPTNLRV